MPGPGRLFRAECHKVDNPGTYEQSHLSD